MDAIVSEIWQKDDRGLGIKWSDGRESHIDVVELRRQCPCALCVDEQTGQRKAQNCDDTVRPVSIDSVGRYAMGVQWSDGHKTGIYTFTMLRRLSECDTTSH